jgi:DNA repair exonuclease SbcCD ATPase subunit
MKIALLLIVLLLQFFPPRAGAAFYQWVDSAGVTHFTDDPDKIPGKYQKRAKKLKISEEPSAVSPDKAQPATPGTGPKAAAPQPPGVNGQSEQLWRERFSELRGELKNLQTLLAEKQEKLVQLRRKRAIYMRAQDREAVNSMQAEIAAAEQRSADLQNQIDALDRQATAAGVPAKWRQ